MSTNEIIATYATRLGDTSLILSHRLSELYATAPTLEENVALTNLSLDHLGQATSFYQYAAKLEGKGNTEDDIAYRRNERQYFNFQLVEQPNIDFAHVILRQYFIDVYNFHFYTLLCDSQDEMLAAVASKSIKEVKYHLRHSSQWVLRLGRGTELAHQKLADAHDHLWAYTSELFVDDAIDEQLVKLGIGVDLKLVKQKWSNDVLELLKNVNLSAPESSYQAKGSKQGMHTEHLGHILSEMQYLPRAYPDAKW